MTSKWMVIGLVLALAGCKAQAAEQVRIEKKTVDLKREDVDREATIHYPVFSGLPPAVLKQLEASAGLQAGTGSSLEEWKAEYQENPLARIVR